MSINKRGAAAANEQRQDTEDYDIRHDFITSNYIGQIFRLAAAVTTDHVYVYANYLNGKVDLTLIVRGHMYDILKDATEADDYLKAIALLEKVQRFLICKDLI